MHIVSPFFLSFFGATTGVLVIYQFIHFFRRRPKSKALCLFIRGKFRTRKNKYFHVATTKVVYLFCMCSRRRLTYPTHMCRPRPCKQTKRRLCSIVSWFFFFYAAFQTPALGNSLTVYALTSYPNNLVYSS